MSKVLNQVNTPSRSRDTYIHMPFNEKGHVLSPMRRNKIKLQNKTFATFKSYSEIT